MAVLYLVEQGAIVHKHGELLVVSREGETRARVPLWRVDQVVISGVITLTTPVLKTLLRRGIDTVFLTVDGRYEGRLIGQESQFGELRLRQLAAAQDGERRLAFARRFVGGKLANERTALQRYAREADTRVLTEAVAGLTRGLGQVRTAADVGSLLGLEGSSTAAYFRGLRAVLRQDLGFAKRARRPPPDPVNALLSFAYTVLGREIETRVRTAGFDPQIGFLHTTVYGRPALALDVLEEFRPVLADAIVLSLINTRRLTAEHFQPGPDERGIYLNEEGKRIFLQRYEDRLNRVVTYPATGQRTTYRRCVEWQVRHLARVVLGGGTEYVPFLVK